MIQIKKLKLRKAVAVKSTKRYLPWQLLYFEKFGTIAE